MHLNSVLRRLLWHDRAAQVNLRTLEVLVLKPTLEVSQISHRQCRSHGPLSLSLRLYGYAVDASPRTSHAST